MGFCTASFLIVFQLRSPLFRLLWYGGRRLLLFLIFLCAMHLSWFRWFAILRSVLRFNGVTRPRSLRLWAFLFFLDMLDVSFTVRSFFSSALVGAIAICVSLCLKVLCF